MIDISIIIPTFNRKKWLKKAIDSCLDQEGVSIEVIVIDDGGTDETKNMMQFLYPNVHYIWQENRGPGSARNRGMQIAKGTYIKFLDSDDILKKNSLVFQYLLLESTGADLAYGRWAHCNEKGIVESREYGYYQPCLFDALLEGEWFANFSYIFRAKCLQEKNIMWDESVLYVADFHYILSVMAKKLSSIYTPVCTGYYRKFPQHTCLSKIGLERKIAYIRILQKAKESMQFSAYQSILVDMRLQLLTTEIEMH